MSSIVQVYTKAVYDNLKPLYANWEPGKPLQLGDFGVMRDYTFVYLGNISQFGIQFASRTNPSVDQKFFASQGSTDVKLKAGVQAPAGGAADMRGTITVSFTSQDAVFFNAAGCEYTMIGNKVDLGKAVMVRYEQDSWQR